MWEEAQMQVVWGNGGERMVLWEYGTALGAQHPQPTTDYYALSFKKARVPGIS